MVIFLDNSPNTFLPYPFITDHLIHFRYSLITPFHRTLIYIDPAPAIISCRARFQFGIDFLQMPLFQCFKIPLLLNRVLFWTRKMHLNCKKSRRTKITIRAAGSPRCVFIKKSTENRSTTGADSDIFSEWFISKNTIPTNVLATKHDITDYCLG